MTTIPEPTISAPVTATENANTFLAAMAALSGVLTDYNIGSQIRTMAEAAASVNEMQGIWSNALVFQGMVYGAMALFGILAGQAQTASGIATFATSTGASPPAASQNVSIPAGTLVQTVGGVQFQTTTAAILLSGLGSVSVPIQALVGGTAGNIPASGITQLITNLGYPLFVNNVSGTTGGTNAESLSQTLSRFSAKVASLPASSPVAIANAAIGVTASGTGETVRYSCLYEPWIAAGSGAGSGTAGWYLYIDNGQGTASSGLIAAVSQVLGATVSGGTLPTSGNVGYRDAGVPYQVLAGQPLYAIVSVSGQVSNSAYIQSASGAIATAVSGYFSLPFGGVAEQGQIAAAASNSVGAILTSLNVTLALSGVGSPVSGIAPPIYQRVLLGSLSISVTSGVVA